MEPSGSDKSSKSTQGDIGYFGLEDWWLTAFTENERYYIQTKYKPLSYGSENDSSGLTSGEVFYCTGTAIGLLTGLAGWFTKPDDRAIAHKILDKAVELSKDASVLELHFLYSHMIEIYFMDRDQPEYREKTEHACRQQIALAPDAAKAFKNKYPKSPLPSHTGYGQLEYLLQKEGRLQDAIALSRQAKSQGWADRYDGWDQRIRRCERKLKKMGN